MQRSIARAKAINDFRHGANRNLN
ncbi:hypothetical protein LUTEI9C_40150 [Luteimonas sp. 9C]|nr:hypothetical protein LUTEI9C_40150 [Luteimonas sp. 9C]